MGKSSVFIFCVCKGQGERRLGEAGTIWNYLEAEAVALGLEKAWL